MAEELRVNAPAIATAVSTVAQAMNPKTKYYDATKLISADLYKTLVEKLGMPVVLESTKPLSPVSLSACIYDKPVDFVLYNDKKTMVISMFRMVQLPGCCGVCVSFHSTVSAEFRSRGIGTLLNKVRMEMARADGYTIMLCTDRMKNEPQRRILEKNGWKDIYRFTNRRTWSDLFISIKELR